MEKKVQTMPQYGSNGRPYDQNRDPLRSSQPSSAGYRTGSGSDNGYGFNGEPLSRPPARSASGTVRRSRTDNSIEFPGQSRPARSADSTSRRSASPRTRSGSSASSRRQTQRPAARNGRPAQSGARQQSRQGYNKNQKLRPAQQRDPQRREGRKKRRMTRAAIRRRRMFRRLTAFALLLCVIGVGIYLTVTMLFRISSLQVQTADGTQVTEIAGYSADSILQVLGVQTEENIFSFDPGAKETVLERQFPLLESIKVVRDYPNTVVVQVTEATPAYAVQSGSSWLTLSDKFKILSADTAQPEGLCTLYGGEVSTSTPGEQLSFAVPTADSTASGSAAASAASAASSLDEADAKMDALTTLRSKLDEYGLLGDVTRIEFADTEQIAFLYQDRISVLLGTLNDLDYKLDRARYMLNNEDGKGCAATDTGRLDFSHVSAGTTRKIYFAQGDPTLPSGYVVPKAPEVTEDTAAPAEDTDPNAADTAGDTAGDTATGEAAPAADEVPITDPARMTANDEANPM